MDWLLLLGRILFAYQFVSAGVNFHLRQREAATGYARMMGAPAPQLTVPLTGIQLIVGGLMIVLGLWVDLAAPSIPESLILDDPEQKAMNQTHFWKNTALIGGAIAFFYLYQQFGSEIGLNIEPALFD